MSLLLAVGIFAVGCGDDDDEGDPTDEEQITQVGEEWADLFGNSDEAMCGYLHADLGAGESTCELYAVGSLTQSEELQSSFAGATVESVKVSGTTALADFSNGHSVAFAQDSDGSWKVLETPRAEASGSSKVTEPTG